jgi:hypothetical protein
MKYFLFYSVLVFFSLLSFHCSATQPVRVLQEDETRIAASLGGPIIPFGSTAIVLPYTTLGIEYGITSDITLFGSIHPTTILFKNVALDGGAAIRILKEEKYFPEVTAKATGYFFWDVGRANDKRFFPMISVNGSYFVGEKKLIYFGADNLYQMHTPRYFLSPFLGYQFPVAENISFQIETKWLALNLNTSHGIFEGYGSLNGRGNVGIYCGMEAGL